MSTSTSVHSNAFNFSSYVESGVDPRTGQYTVAIRLPELKGNDLQGPDFDLALFYSPLNTVDSGYGKGWNLQLTQLRERNQVVTLSSGESYKITDESNGRLLMREQKLRQFDLYRAPPGPGGARRYRVVHRSGLEEVLQVMGGQQAEVALPVELHSPLGHVLHLAYEAWGTEHMRLSTVSDAGGTLLAIERGGGPVELLCYPFGASDGGPLARYVMTLSGADNRVSQIILPTANQACWTFTYREVRGLLCVSEVHTPYGGHESLFYEDVGHAFPPSAGQANLPRVTRHEIAPRFEQPAMQVTYEYPGVSNFLGGGSSVPWDPDGLDNLYQVAADYTYGSVESWLVDNQPARVITRTFNRFHLLTSQKTVQGDKVLEAITEYGQTDGGFDAQPPSFQLPVMELKRWSLESQPTRQREEKVHSSYDNHGNLLTRLQANGVLETQTWYQAPEAGYPDDGHGFVRHLKTRTVTPAASGQGTAATLKQHYRYTALAPLGNDLEKPCLLVESEQLLDAGNSDALLEQTAYRYYNQPDALPFSYGRVLDKTLSYPGELAGTRLDTISLYEYSKPPGTGALQTDESLNGYDGEFKHILLQHDLQTGEPLLNRDDNDVEIRYQYDALRRVTRETVAPGTDYEAFRHYRYFLCAHDNEQAQQWAYDVKQVETHTLFDGLRRVVSEAREDTDSATYAGASRPVYRGRYDELGQLVEETEIDWLGDQLLELTSRYAYDDWGEQYSVTGPEGVTAVQMTDQVASSAGPVRFEWRQRAEFADAQGQPIRLSGTVRTDLNLFEQPIRIERLDLAGQRISLQVNEHDGLGRISKQTLGIGTGTQLRVESFVHDPFDRQQEHHLADRNNRVYRTYARHSREDLPVSIRVGSSFASASLLGEQAFDGLGRRTRATTGGRVQTFSYDPGQRQPRTVTAPDGTEVAYTYLPALGEEPVSRLLAGTPANYSHDKHNARLLHCDEPGQAVDRTYFSNGDLKTEKRTLEGQDGAFEMTYDHSYRSRLRAYVDVQGQTQLYEYDAYGRLAQTTLQAAPASPEPQRLRRTTARQAQPLLSATFTYDLLSRLQSTTTVDLESGRQLVTSLEYDEFDREILRTFDFGDSVQALEQGYDQFDCLEYRTLTELAKGAGAGAATELRHETYQYDLRGRLSVYTCRGPLAPVDPSGMVIARQNFGFDALDNITSVITLDPDNKVQRTMYEFKNTDPVQLSKIVNSRNSPPGPDIELHYDLNGNLISDEQGRALHYDGLNRLLSVDTPDGKHCSYHYDPENILSGTTEATKKPVKKTASKKTASGSAG